MESANKIYLLKILIVIKVEEMVLNLFVKNVKKSYEIKKRNYQTDWCNGSTSVFQAEDKSPILLFVTKVYSIMALHLALNQDNVGPNPTRLTKSCGVIGSISDC